MAGASNIRPLYAGVDAAVDRVRDRAQSHGPMPAGAHAGLWYDKMYSEVAPDPRRPDKQAHQRWFQTVTGVPVGRGDQIDEVIGRRCLMVESLGGVLGYFEAMSRFVTGLGRTHPVENGFAWHPTLGTPYLPGSSIKGLVLAWARDAVADAAQRDMVLGTRERAGRVVFLDALPVAPVTLEADVMTPHYGPYYQREDEVPGDWHSPVPITFLVAGAGMKLQAAVLAAERVHVAGGTADDMNDGAAMARTAMDWLTRALAELGAGAKTAVGYGRFRRFEDERIGEPWVRGVRERRRAATIKAMTPLDRAREEVAAMSEQDAMTFVRQAREGRDERTPEDREALRQALREHYLERWETQGMANVGKKKRRDYLAWLKGEQAT